VAVINEPPFIQGNTKPQEATVVVVVVVVVVVEVVVVVVAGVVEQSPHKEGQ
jgi:hypothetical protein